MEQPRRQHVLGPASRSPGAYDLNVLYVPDDRKVKADADLGIGPSLPLAFLEQLGLKLEKGKGPVK